MKKFLIIFFTVTNICFSQFYTWEHIGEMDRAVAGGAAIKLSENILIIGGYSDSLQAPVNWIQKYNIFSGNWEIDSISVPRFGLVTDKYNEFAYFFGGINDESSSISGIERWQENITDETVFAFDINFNRNFSTGHIIGDKFYIIGGNSLPGTSSDKLPYLAEYNLIDSEITFQTDSLFNTGDLPEQQMSEVIGNDIFIFGGVVNGISQDIYKFNTENHTYEKLNIKLLEPRAGGKAILSSQGDKIYIIGGYNENLEVLSSVEIFMVYGDQYEITEGPPLNFPRYNFMSEVVEDMLYIFGGYDDEKNVVKSIEALYDAAITGIETVENEIVSDNFELYQNYPNPFNPNTTISYRVPVPSSISLKVYDIIGNEIITLVNEKKEAGLHRINFNAANLSSGIYYYQLIGNNFTQIKKMILLK